MHISDYDAIIISIIKRENISWKMKFREGTSTYWIKYWSFDIYKMLQIFLQRNFERKSRPNRKQLRKMTCSNNLLILMAMCFQKLINNS